MRDPLFVITGAGASKDCTSPNTPPRLQGIEPPPLVTELFNYYRTLEKYPVAKLAAAELRVAAETAPALEEHIRTTYLDSPLELHQRVAASLPFYLQEVLFDRDQEFGAHADNYQRLVAALLPRVEPIFITLNYDTLLDQQLAIVTPIASLDDFVRSERGWSLIKLHGSTTWGFPKRGVVNVHNPPPGIGFDRTFVFRNHLDLEGRRFEPAGEGTTYFPALSVPVGAKDEVTCPDEHLDFLRERLRLTEHIDLLVIGYSANDQEVLNLFRTHQSKLRSVAVVESDRKRGDAVAIKLSDELDLWFEGVQIYDRGFDGFAASADLSAYLDDPPARPPF
jgi:hypothetical protein